MNPFSHHLHPSVSVLIRDAAAFAFHCRAAFPSISKLTRFDMN